MEVGRCRAGKVWVSRRIFVVTFICLYVSICFFIVEFIEYFFLELG